VSNRDSGRKLLRTAMRLPALLGPKWGRTFDGSDDRGFALIAVIIGSAIVATLALTLLTYSRTLSSASALYAADIETRSWAESGLNRILLAYSRPDDPLRQRLNPDGRPVAWDYHGRTVTLSVRAESGKIDVNAGDRNHIARLLSLLIDSSQLRSIILDRIDAARSGGENIRSVAEILPPFERMTSVRDRLDSYFTVYTNQTGIDVATAPSLVIETMPGLPPQLAADILRARSIGAPITMANLPSEIAHRFGQQRPIYTFRAETSSGFTKARAMRAVVLYGERNKYSILAWETVGIAPSSSAASGMFAPSGL
jgi:hypothetical protein